LLDLSADPFILLLGECTLIRFLLISILELAASASDAATVGKLRQSAWQEARASCKQVSSCEEAVILWCGGYGRADGDDDGIPCENVCHSRAEVGEIQKSIGCTLSQ
jgi:hypothetical protein